MGVERSTMISSVIDRNVAEKPPDTTDKFPLQEIEGNQEDTINGWEIIYLMHRNSLSRLKKADKKGFFSQDFLESISSLNPGTYACKTQNQLQAVSTNEFKFLQNSLLTYRTLTTKIKTAQNWRWNCDAKYRRLQKLSQTNGLQLGKTFHQ